MSTSEARKLYDALNENNELKTLYRSMTGDWGKDKRKFVAQYEENMELINSVYKKQ